MVLRPWLYIPEPSSARGLQAVDCGVVKQCRTHLAKWGCFYVLTLFVVAGCKHYQRIHDHLRLQLNTTVTPTRTQNREREIEREREERGYSYLYRSI